MTTDQTELEAIASRVADLAVGNGDMDEAEKRDAIVRDLRALARRGHAVPEGWKTVTASEPMRGTTRLGPYVVEGPYGELAVSYAVDNEGRHYEKWARNPIEFLPLRYIELSAVAAMLAASPAHEGCGACGDGCNGGPCRVETESPPAPAPEADQPARIEFTIREAQRLVEFFGGHDATVTVEAHPDRVDDDRMLFAGLYAHCTDYPEEGAVYLGPAEVQDDDGSSPAPESPEACAGSGADRYGVHEIGGLTQWVKAPFAVVRHGDDVLVAHSTHRDTAEQIAAALNGQPHVVMPMEEAIRVGNLMLARAHSESPEAPKECPGCGADQHDGACEPQPFEPEAGQGVEVLASEVADMEVDSRGRKQWSFDNHGLAEFARRLASAQQSASEWPECSGNPADCPENEGYGCCGRAQTDHSVGVNKMVRQPSAPAAVPDGYVLMPVPATPKMLSIIWYPAAKPRLSLTKRQTRRAEAAYTELIAAAGEGADDA